MVTNDGTIIQIKHDILCEVAKLVFAGKFETEKDELPYRMMPGPKAKYRCCDNVTGNRAVLTCRLYDLYHKVVM